MRGTPGGRDVIDPTDSCAKHFSIEKQERAQRLILRRGRDLPLYREPGDKRAHLVLAHLGRVALAVEQDVAPNPGDVRLLGFQAVVSRADGLAYAVEQAWCPGREW